MTHILQVTLPVGLLVYVGYRRRHSRLAADAEAASGAEGAGVTPDAADAVRQAV